MATIYRKTEKGQTEMATRQHGLSPKLRSALILVDGRRAEDELLRLIPGPGHELLKSLLDEGFIEALATTATGKVVTASSAARAAAEGDTHGAETGKEPAGPTLSSLGVQAARFLTEQLGPMADTVTLRIEKSRAWQELKPLLTVGMRMLRDHRGAGTADAFRARFLDPY